MRVPKGHPVPRPVPLFAGLPYGVPAQVDSTEVSMYDASTLGRNRVGRQHRPRFRVSHVGEASGAVIDRAHCSCVTVSLRTIGRPMAEIGPATYKLRLALSSRNKNHSSLVLAGHGHRHGSKIPVARVHVYCSSESQLSTGCGSRCLLWGRPSPGDLATLKIPNSISGKPRNSLKNRGPGEEKFHAALR